MILTQRKMGPHRAETGPELRAFGTFVVRKSMTKKLFTFYIIHKIVIMPIFTPNHSLGYLCERLTIKTITLTLTVNPTLFIYYANISANIELTD